MFSTFTVIYDACVLYSAVRRDLFMRLALTGLYRARWTVQIQEEWIEALLRNKPKLCRKRLERTVDLMNESVLDCLVHGHESLIEALELPDPNDRHVLAAAIRSGASEIITLNLKDFPKGKLLQYGVEARDPDEFVDSLFDLSASSVISAAARQRKALENPAVSVSEFLDNLTKAELPMTASRLSEYSELL